MKNISKSPFFYKRIFPFVLALPVLLFCFLPFSGTRNPPPVFFCVVPVVGWAMFMMLWWQLFRPLADEVMEGGDSFLVTMQGRQFEVPMANVINVSATMMTNPPIVSMRLRVAGPYGRDISFLPSERQRLGFLRSNAFVNDLVDRIDVQRQGAARKRL